MEIPIGILSPKMEHSSEIAIAGIFGLEAYRALRYEILPISNNKDIVKLLMDPIVFSNFFHTWGNLESQKSSRAQWFTDQHHDHYQFNGTQGEI